MDTFLAAASQFTDPFMIFVIIFIAIDPPLVSFSLFAIYATSGPAMIWQRVGAGGRVRLPPSDAKD